MRDSSGMFFSFVFMFFSFVLLPFSIVVVTRGSSSGSGLGVDFELIDERIRGFIMLEIMRGILDATPIMFGTIMKGIM